MLSDKEIKQIQGSQDELEGQYPKMFGALGDPTRWKLFSILTEHKDLCVTDLARVLGVSVPAVSQQLRTLEASGLVYKTRNGQSMCYHIENKNPVTKMFVKLVQSQ